MEQIETIGQGVFSIVVACYLLLRMENRIAALTEAINRLRHCATCRFSQEGSYADNPA